MVSQAIIEYRQALERIKANATIRIPKGSKATNDNVALEAGRKKGSVRPSLSDEMSELCAEIKAVSKALSKKIKANRPAVPRAAIETRDAEIEALKRENDQLRSRYMSLLYLNYELTQKLMDSGQPVPKTAQVIPFKVKEDLPNQTETSESEDYPF